MKDCWRCWSDASTGEFDSQAVTNITKHGQAVTGWMVEACFLPADVREAMCLNEDDEALVVIYDIEAWEPGKQQPKPELN